MGCLTSPSFSFFTCGIGVDRPSSQGLHVDDSGSGWLAGQARQRLPGGASNPRPGRGLTGKQVSTPSPTSLPACSLPNLHASPLFFRRPGSFPLPSFYLLVSVCGMSRVSPDLAPSHSSLPNGPLTTYHYTPHLSFCSPWPCFISVIERIII